MNNSTSIKIFENYRQLGMRSMEQLSGEQLLWRPNATTNSIAIIVSHMSGNMISRFTNFLTEDGEKSWRKRDAEFEPVLQYREEIYTAWNRGWDCMLASLSALTTSDIDKTVFIRGEPHTIQEAVERQLAHHASHVGQIIFIAKMQLDNSWQTLSIPKGQSATYNEQMFGDKK